MQDPRIGEGDSSETYEGAEHEVVVECHGGMVEERSLVGIARRLDK